MIQLLKLLLVKPKNRLLLRQRRLMKMLIMKKNQLLNLKIQLKKHLKKLRLFIINRNKPRLC